MTWAKFDDRFPSHLKVLRLSDAAFRLFVTGVCFSCQHGTDGAIDDGIPEALTRAPVGKACAAAVAELERFGLWERTENGWSIHDFLDWNPSAEQVVQTREVRSAAGRLGGQRSGKARAKPKQLMKQTLQQNRSKPEANASANDEAKHQAKTNPVPVPVPVPEEDLPPTPQPDRFTNSFRSTPAAKREDVQRVHREWLRVFKFPPETELVRNWNTVDADCLAQAIDTHGEQACLAMLRHAPSDGMVSGRSDDRGVKHESLAYLFGPNLPRLIRDAQQSTRKTVNGAASQSEIERRKREE